MPLIGNKCIEKDVRDWLSRNGYYGNSARFLEMELHAIKRPGWLQVFRFTVEAKSRNGKWMKLHGSARDDERYNHLTIKIFVAKQQQQAVLRDWSTGLICRQSSRGEDIMSIPMMGLIVFLFFGGVVSLLYLTSLLTN